MRSWSRTATAVRCRIRTACAVCHRCTGPAATRLRYSRQVVEKELNSVTDNPLVFQNGDIISGGNFHGQPLALALDHAKIALAEFASISERRTYLLLEGHDGLPDIIDGGDRYQLRIYDSAIYFGSAGFGKQGAYVTPPRLIPFLPALDRKIT
ncbi:MAG: aromatic amino acid lyase [Fodinibius sp.]|nr:aromatic amino acid lyase [Fodinibius sp.]